VACWSKYCEAVHTGNGYDGARIVSQSMLFSRFSIFRSEFLYLMCLMYLNFGISILISRLRFIILQNSAHERDTETRKRLTVDGFRDAVDSLAV
jgi:hypothetical protein